MYEYNQSRRAGYSARGGEGASHPSNPQRKCNSNANATQRNATQLRWLRWGGEGGLNPCSAPADAERGSRTCEVLNCQLTLSQYRISHAVHVCFSEGCAPALDRRRESVTRRSSSAGRRRAIRTWSASRQSCVALRCVVRCVALTQKPTQLSCVGCVVTN